MAQITRRAFTMIELLVVISIIIILLTILLPVLAKTRTVAKIATCSANTGELAKALDQHRRDHDNIYLSSNTSDWNFAGISGGEVRELNPYLHLDTQWSVPTGDRGEIAASVAMCPLDKGTSSTAPQSVWVAKGNSYVYFPEGGPRSGILPVAGMRASKIPNPKTKLLVADTIVDFANYAANNSRHHWHNDQSPLHVSVGFADGHSETYVERKESGTVSSDPLKAARSMPYY